MARRLTVGVVALQGSTREHLEALERCGVEGFSIKNPQQMKRADALIVPGGESTAIGRLMEEYGFLEPLDDLHEKGVPLYGSCAGLILLAKKVIDGDQPRLGLMDIAVRRNAFGRQRDSFEADLDISEIGRPPFRAVFIRAPWIESADVGVEVLAEHRGRPVMARQGSLLVTAFHPELTEDLRVHRYFLQMISDN